MLTGVGELAGVGSGMNVRNAKPNPQIAAVIPDQTKAEMRAQFLSRSTPTPVKIPKIARPAKNAMAPTVRLRTKLGNCGPVWEAGVTRIARTIKHDPSRVSTLPIMATIPAAVTEAERFLKVFTTLIYHSDYI